MRFGLCLLGLRFAIGQLREHNGGSRDGNELDMHSAFMTIIALMLNRSDYKIPLAAASAHRSPVAGSDQCVFDLLFAAAGCAFPPPRVSPSPIAFSGASERTEALDGHAGIFNHAENNN